MGSSSSMIVVFTVRYCPCILDTLLFLFACHKVIFVTVEIPSEAAHKMESSSLISTSNITGAASSAVTLHNKYDKKGALVQSVSLQNIFRPTFLYKFY